MILYFTGTGNSRFVADELGKRLEEIPADILEYIKENRAGYFESEKPYIFVTPTYAWRVPHIVENFIRNSNFNGNKECYFVLTCGDGIGSAGKHAKELCEQKDLEYKGIFKIVMPENYIAMFEAPGEEESEKIVKDSISDIDKAARYISQLKFHEKKQNVIDDLLSGIVNKAFYSAFVKDKKFRVSESCNGCGLCVKKCPLNNISIENGHPVWHGNCTHCMACITSCPKEAIEYGKKSVGQPRYKCPGLSERESR